MRKIPIQPPDDDEWKKWLNDCEEATKINIEAVKNGQKPQIESRLYRRKKIKDSFFFSKNAPFYGKCAYCETYIADFQPGDIEHFRPKAAVTNEDDQKISLKDSQGNPILDQDGKPKPHPGYYWLGYEWTNLLPSCAGCNRSQSGRIGKRNRFPVQGNHAQLPGEEQYEEPLLINPASQNDDDDPAKHLFVDPKTGVMSYYTERGRMCIEIFGLNKRDQLRNERIFAISRVRAILLEMQEAINNPQQCLQIMLVKTQELIDIVNGKEPCTIAALTILQKKSFSLKTLTELKQKLEKALN